MPSSTAKTTPASVAASFRASRRAEVFAVKVSGGSEFSAGKPVALVSGVSDLSGTPNHPTSDVHPDGPFMFVARSTAAQDDPYGGLYRFQIVVNWIAEVEARVPVP